MKMNTAIFGAGIMGQAIYALLKKDSNVICFFDNNPSEPSFDGVPIKVFSPERVKELAKIYIAVMNEEACQTIKQQLLDAGVPAVKIRSYKEVLLYRARYEFLYEAAKSKSTGCAAELGVFRGEFAREINAAFPNSRVYLFDTFEGFPASDLSREEVCQNTVNALNDEFRDTSIETVLSKMPHPENVIIKKGVFPDTFDLNNEQFVFVSLDADLYAPTLAGLLIFYPLMIRGGVILVHDYFNDYLPGVSKAVDEFCKTRAMFFTPIGDGSSVCILKL